MSVASSTIKDLARRLLSFEAANGSFPKAAIFDVALRVCEKLRTPFSRLAGPSGFSSFLARALVLAKAVSPSLLAMEVQADGTLARRDAVKQGQATPIDDRAGVVLVEQLLLLLVTFIGEKLTVTLVLDAWPDGAFDRTNVYAEEKP